MLLQFAKSPKASCCDAKDGEKGEDGGEEVLPPLAVAAEAEDDRPPSAFSSLGLYAGEEANENQDISHHFSEQFISPAGN